MVRYKYPHVPEDQLMTAHQARRLGLSEYAAGIWNARVMRVGRLRP